MPSEKLKNAVFDHDDKQLRSLLQAGADANEPDANGVVPLFHAIHFGGVETVRLLLQAGADVNHTNWNGYSPWFAAVESKDRRKILLLKEYNADRTISNHLGYNTLHLTAMRGDLRLFHELIHHSPKTMIRAVNHRGNTILHLAASWHNPLIVRICLTHASELIDVRNATGESALEIAARSGRMDIIELLLNAVAIYDNAKDYQDRLLSIFRLASGKQDVCMIEMLLRNGFEVDLSRPEIEQAIDTITDIELHTLLSGF